MIKHVVMFRLKGSEAQRREKASAFRDALLALPDQIKCLKSLEVGLNCNTAETWDLVLTAEVDSMADLEAYSTHPLHQEAVGIIKDCKESRACVDFVI